MLFNQNLKKLQAKNAEIESLLEQNRQDIERLKAGENAVASFLEEGKKAIALLRSTGENSVNRLKSCVLAMFQDIPGRESYSHERTPFDSFSVWASEREGWFFLVGEYDDEASAWDALLEEVERDFSIISGQVCFRKGGQLRAEPVPKDWKRVLLTEETIAEYNELILLVEDYQEMEALRKGAIASGLNWAILLSAMPSDTRQHLEDLEEKGC
jgi:hypothetical protein